MQRQRMFQKGLEKGHSKAVDYEFSSSSVGWLFGFRDLLSLGHT